MTLLDHFDLIPSVIPNKESTNVRHYYYWGEPSGLNSDAKVLNVSAQFWVTSEGGGILLAILTVKYFCFFRFFFSYRKYNKIIFFYLIVKNKYLNNNANFYCNVIEGKSAILVLPPRFQQPLTRLKMYIYI